eukprot:754925-Hanusia_phi.AAC.1
MGAMAGDGVVDSLSSERRDLPEVSSSSAHRRVLGLRGQGRGCGSGRCGSDRRGFSGRLQSCAAAALT